MLYFSKRILYYINTDRIGLFFYLIFMMVISVELAYSSILSVQRSSSFFIKDVIILRKVKYCECGCKERVKEGNRFINGHNNLFCKNNKIGFGRKHTEETKKKMSNAAKGRHFSKETKRKMSVSGKIKKFSKEHRKKLSEAKRESKHCFYGKHHSKETKKKLSAATLKNMIQDNKGKFKPKVGKLEVFFEENILKNIKELRYISQQYIKNVGFVDFFLPNYGIIIECDEKHHNSNKQKVKDSTRDFAAMFGKKYKTIRFWEYEINESPEKCMKIVLKEINYV